jgi:cysteine desulfurase
LTTLDENIIYLDYQATTPIDPRVLELMLPWLRDCPGNPHSQHKIGQKARQAVEEARANVASLIGAQAEEIVFTSGATEAANIAIRSFIPTKGSQIVTSEIEHSCVRETMADLLRKGVPVLALGVDPDCLVSPSETETVLTRKTALVSVMAVNNETGVIQPFEEIGGLCRRRGVAFFTDGAQAAGKIDIDVERDSIDMMSLSSHKIYGPQGIGALYCRSSFFSKLKPLMTGGGQERGLRSGTLPTALCVGFGAACAIARQEMKDESSRILCLRNSFLTTLSALVDGFQVNGSLEFRIPGNLNLSFRDVDAELLLARLPDVAVSTGSACTSAAIEPSHVLIAMGLDREAADSSVRIGFGRNTDAADVETAALRIGQEIKWIRDHC